MGTSARGRWILTMKFLQRIVYRSKIYLRLQLNEETTITDV